MKEIIGVELDNLKGTIYEVHKGVYVFEIPDRYDRAMFFCKYQEFYESPIEEIRGKHFTLVEFMRAYKEYTKEDTFTYPRDWEGFNIPSDVLSEAIWRLGGDCKYDTMMEEIFDLLSGLRKRFYLIGVDSVKSSIYKHEMAHALWYLDSKYKSSVKKLMKDIDAELYQRLVKKIVKMGYPEDMAEDEIQAYLCHGWKVPHHSEIFRKNLDKYL